MLADVMMFCALTLVAWIDSESWWGRLALAAAFTTLLRLAWQFYVFLRTDLYYVIVTLLGCTDLHSATSEYLRRRFGALPGVRPATTGESDWAARDRQMAPWFALLTVVGVGVLLAITAFAAIPILMEFGTRLVSALSGGTGGGARFWDSAVSLLIIVVELIVLPLIVGRRRRRTP